MKFKQRAFEFQRLVACLEWIGLISSAHLYIGNILYGIVTLDIVYQCIMIGKLSPILLVRYGAFTTNQWWDLMFHVTSIDPRWWCGNVRITRRLMWKSRLVQSRDFCLKYFFYMYKNIWNNKIKIKQGIQVDMQKST